MIGRVRSATTHTHIVAYLDGRFLDIESTAQHFVAGNVGSVKAAVLYEKPRSVINCEYVSRRTDKWINFPWSSEPPIVGPTPHTINLWAAGDPEDRLNGCPNL